jgi:uncharacterized protein YdaU (DUF1376 family)
MAKDPAFLFYASDFLTGTMFMTNEQVGLYIRMLCAQHQHGGRIDTNVLRTQCDSITNGSLVYSKFEHDDTGSYSLRLDEEMKKRREKGIKARESVNKRWKKDSFDSNTFVLRSENESEDEIEIKTQEEKAPEKPKTKKPEIPTESEFMAYYKSELSKEFPDLDFSIKTKYETWVDAGWKDGHGNKITNWKLKMKNTITHLKAKFNPNGPTQSGPLSFSSKNMNR